jgi:glucose-1-phosphate adenylyltransferase
MILHASKGLPATSAVILAGGQGERLHPLTVSRPKPAVSFGGFFRIIDFTLSNCFHSGVGRVSLLTQYRYEELHQYIRKGWNQLWNSGGHRSPLVCLPPVSGQRYRGTADAVFRNMELLESDESEYVLILSGDHIYQMDYRDMVRHHMEKGADLTIATVEHPSKDASHFGVVEVDGNFKVTGFAEKPSNPVPLPSRPSMALVSMGVYIFRKNILLATLRAHCDEGRGFDFGHNIVPSMIPSGRTYAYDFRDEISDSPRYWRDIGTIDAYYRASMDLMGPDAPFDPFANDGWPSEPTRHPVAGLKQTTQRRESKVSNSVVSPDVHIAEGAIVEDSILMPGVRIGKGVRLRRAIVEEGVYIPDRVTAGFDPDHDRNNHTVTRDGVVVVNQIRSNRKPAVLQFVQSETRKQQTAMGFTA